MPTRYTTGIDLSDPDAQCQPHRTGLLCSKCAEGYSVVIGLNKCKNFSNLHYFTWFISFLLGYFFVTLFVLNLTVTSGTINDLTLYVNLVWIISLSFLLHFEKKLSILDHHLKCVSTMEWMSMLYCGYNRYIQCI